MTRKKTVLFTLCLGFLLSASQNFCAAEVKNSVADNQENSFALEPVSQENVEKNHQSIARMMSLHWYTRMGMQVGTGLLAVYWLSRFFVGGNPGQEAIQANGGVSSLPVPSNSDLIIRIAALEKCVTPPGWFTFKWWKNKALAVGDYVLWSSLYSLAKGGLVDRFYHDDTIEWFVKSRTRFESLGAEVKFYAQRCILSQDLSQEQMHYHRVTLVGICRSLVREVEQVAAFMEYEIEQFKNRGAVLANDELLQVPHLIASTNRFISDMKKLQLSATQSDTADQVKKLFGVAVQFVVDFEQQVKRFAGLENAIEWRLIQQ